MTCENCGTKINVRRFYPPDGQDYDEHWVYFCEQCFLSDEVCCDEPISYDEKLTMWSNAKPQLTPRRNEN